ncbi:hypothetical protein LQG66_29790 [Bradyrhizobium ontarionense]|uniref:Uncharacterized protein n=1 Tax=Bradyrhizobium ontarionense TaxID=2898149 RepID=A0ABY3R7S6_9BRAD|nr:hypothetical protein [Bradyrhizobium sp. A19]UFZ03383.1 hypothetical protein LQG66_29790 [Bradyrhizobium sp. A19]
MASINSKQTLRRDLLLAGGLLGIGALVAIISLAEIRANHVDHVAQATPEPSATPAESKPGGTRPTTPAPEPARPDVEAQKEGVKPALPPAPAEKVAPPMEKK